MNRALWKKCLTESALLFAALWLGIAAFAWFRVHVVGEVDTSSFQRIIDLLPDEWLKYTSVDVEWLVSYVGRTAMTLDEPFLIMMLAIWAIVRGSDVVSGEISRGTMELLLAQPVSRHRVFWIHTLVTILGLLVLTLTTWLFMWLGVLTTEVNVVPETERSLWSLPLQLLPGYNPEPKLVATPMADFVNAWLFAPGILNLFLLSCYIAALTTLISSVDRFRWRTLGLGVGIYMGSAMVKILAMTSSVFAWTNWLTFFSLYEPELAVKLTEADPVNFWSLAHYEDGVWQGFGQFAQNLILIGGTAVFLVVASRIFHRRDIPQPL